MSYSIIAAIGKNNELGNKNELIWHLKNDMKFFREKTTGKTIIMGRKTFESLPKMLPNRKHIVLSSSSNFPKEVEVFSDFDALLESLKDTTEEIFVIGGSSIYKLFLDYSSKLYLTEIDASSECDAYFPDFDKSLYEREVIAENEEEGIAYKHVLYKKK